MDLGPKNHTLHGLRGPKSIIGTLIGPSGLIIMHYGSLQDHIQDGSK